MSLSGLMIIEAVNSVALEHEEDCSCMVCRAASGDVRAMAAVFVAARSRESDAADA